MNTSPNRVHLFLLKVM